MMSLRKRRSFGRCSCIWVRQVGANLLIERYDTRCMLDLEKLGAAGGEDMIEEEAVKKDINKKVEREINKIASD